MQRLYRIRELEKQVAELTSRLDAVQSDDERVQAMISEIAVMLGQILLKAVITVISIPLIYVIPDKQIVTD